MTTLPAGGRYCSRSTVQRGSEGTLERNIGNIATPVNRIEKGHRVEIRIGALVDTHHRFQKNREFFVQLPPRAAA